MQYRLPFETTIGPDPEPEVAPWGSFVWRNYQIEWRDGTYAAWKDHKIVLGSAATGLGKSSFSAGMSGLCSSGSLDALVPACERATLFITHRDHLITQAFKDFRKILPHLTIEIEQGDSRVTSSADIVIASRNSLRQHRRLKRLGKSRFSQIIIDEFHNYNSYQRQTQAILGWFHEQTKVLALTATPDGGQCSSLVQAIAFDYPIVRAIQDGWLVPAVQAFLQIDSLDLAAIIRPDKDFDESKISEKLQDRKERAKIVMATIKYSLIPSPTSIKFGGLHRPAWVCCPSVAIAVKVQNDLNDLHDLSIKGKIPPDVKAAIEKEIGREIPAAGTGRAAAFFKGQKKSEREQIWREYNAGLIKYLTFYDVLSEGVDDDEVRVMINARPFPRHMRHKYGQVFGRIIRPIMAVRNALQFCPDAAARRSIIASSSKPAALMVDLVGLNHSLSCNTAEVIGAGAGPDVVEKMRASYEMQKFTRLPVDFRDPIKELEAAKRSEERKIKREEDATNRPRYIFAGSMQLRKVDPFEFSPQKVGIGPRMYRGRKMEKWQENFLKKQGIPVSEVDTFDYWRAHRAHMTIMNRIRSGLSSYRQCRLLEKFGYDGSNMLFSEASSLLDLLINSAKGQGQNYNGVPWTKNTQNQNTSQGNSQGYGSTPPADTTG